MKKNYTNPAIELRWFEQNETIAATQSGFVDSPNVDDGEFDLGTI